MGDKSISSKVNWGQECLIGKVIGVGRGEENEGRIKFVDFGRGACRMCEQLSPACKGHDGSRSTEQWNHDCGSAANAGALSRRHQAALLVNRFVD
jgi:hypothetical protein